MFAYEKTFSIPAAPAHKGLLAQAEQALASVDDPTQNGLDGIQSFQLRSFAGATPSTEKATLELLLAVRMSSAERREIQLSHQVAVPE